jgi:putative endonuclease
VNSNNLDFEVRFDIISVYKENNEFKMEHIEDAFYHF